MSFESGLNSIPAYARTEKVEPEEQVEKFLNAFHPDLRDGLEARIEGMEIEKQLEFLEGMLKKRREVISVSPYTSDRLRMLDKVSSSVFDRFEKKEHQVEVGRGENGRVFEYKSNDDDGTTVFKILIRVPLDYQNSLLSEGAYQADVAAFADAHAGLGIGVPHPFYVAGSSKGYVLAMEKVPGYSLDEMSKHSIRLPDTLDLDLIQSQLEDFVREMNKFGFYHRDLRAGNIMINPAAGDREPKAYLIDFGFCTKADSSKEAYSKLDGLQDHVMIERVMSALKDKQKLIQQGV